MKNFALSANSPKFCIHGVDGAWGQGVLIQGQEVGDPGGYPLASKRIAEGGSRN